MNYFKEHILKETIKTSVLIWYKVNIIFSIIGKKILTNKISPVKIIYLLYCC